MVKKIARELLTNLLVISWRQKAGARERGGRLEEFFRKPLSARDYLEGGFPA
jgi:hypothetical protein